MMAQDERKIASAHASASNKPFAEKLAKVLVAGGGSGLVEALVMFPTEYVKTQLQLQKKGETKFKGPMDVVTKTVQENGVRGLYRGVTALMLNSVPQKAVRFTAFELVSDPLKDEKGQLSNSKRMLAGAFAGAVEAIFPVTPAETIKTKLIDDFNRPAAQRKYNGVIQGVPTIVREEGFGGIYKGLTATVIKQTTNQAVRFSVQGWTEDQLKQNFKMQGWYVTFITGFVAGGVSVYANNPIDVVKTKMQGIEAKQYKNTFDCALQIMRNQGFFFFYKGVTPRLLRVCGDTAISFTEH